MIFTIYIYIYIYTLRSPTYIIGSSLPIYIYYTPGSGIQVHEMLNILAKNPVFASNPACLADFVKSLVATSAQAIPTPMHKPAGEPDPTPTTPSAAAAPAMAVQHNTGVVMRLNRPKLWKHVSSSGRSSRGHHRHHRRMLGSAPDRKLCCPSQHSGWVRKCLMRRSQSK